MGYRWRRFICIPVASAVSTMTYFGRAGFLGPVDDEEFQAACHDLILVVAALLVMQHFARAFDQGRQL